MSSRSIEENIGYAATEVAGELLCKARSVMGLAHKNNENQFANKY